MPKSLHGLWVVDPMSELSRFVYNRSHVMLHVKSKAEKVNCPFEDILPQLNDANYFEVADAISGFTKILQITNQA